MNANELLKQVGVSGAATVHFARRFVFFGNPQMVRARKELFFTDKTTPLSTFSNYKGQVLEQACGCEQKNLQILAESQQDDFIEWIVDKMLKSAHVILLASQTSLAAASFAGIELRMFNKKFNWLDSVSSNLIEKLGNIDGQTLVVAIVTWRNAQKTVEAVTHCRRQGACLAVITDDVGSPLIPLSDKTVIVTDNAPFRPPTLPGVVISILVWEYGLRATDEEKTRFNKMCEIMTEQKIWFFQQNKR